MQRRSMVRVVVLDRQRRVLLLRNGSGSNVYWALPGGSVEDDEVLTGAAQRAVRDETGLTDVTIDAAPLLRRSHTLLVAGEEWRINEVFLGGQRTSSGEMTSAAGQETSRWLTLDELRAINDPVQPDGLAEIVAGMSAGAATQRPGAES